MMKSQTIFAAAVAVVCAACASHTPKPATKAPALYTLPAKATFAWVRPSELFADATSGDEESAGTGAARSMRLDVEALLLGQGWSKTPAESAQFVATVAIVQRTTYRTETRTVQASQPPQPARCDLTRTGGRGGGSTCPVAPPSRTETINVPVGETHPLLAMRRRADGAQTVRTSPDLGTKQAGGYFVKELIALLKVKARD